MTIKIFLADDHQMLIDGFSRSLIDFGFEIAGSESNIHHVIDAFLKSHADILISDIRFGQDKDGLEMIEELLQIKPDAKVIVLSQFNDAYIVEKSYQIGVRGFVSKNESVLLLKEALQQVYGGDKYISSAIAKSIAWGTLDPKHPYKLLNERERLIFLKLANGATTNEAQEASNVSYKTFTTTVAEIKNKLNVRTNSELTKIAIQYGLINPN